MAKKADAGNRVIEAAMELAADAGWRKVTLAQIAERADLSLPDLYRDFASKDAILAGVSHRIDEAMLGEGAADPADSPRDRLFDLLMRRFDALQAHRPGLVAIAKDLRGDPLTSLALLPQLERSMGWTLEAAGLGSSGLLGAARVRVLGLVYLSVVQVWLKDETPDMASTMKALDGRLARVEQLANSLGGGLRRPGPKSADTPGDTGLDAPD